MKMFPEIESAEEPCQARAKPVVSLSVVRGLGGIDTCSYSETERIAAQPGGCDLLREILANNISSLVAMAVPDELDICPTWFTENMMKIVDTLVRAGPRREYSHDVDQLLREHLRDHSLARLVFSEGSVDVDHFGDY